MVLNALDAVLLPACAGELLGLAVGGLLLAALRGLERWPGAAALGVPAAPSAARPGGAADRQIRYNSFTTPRRTRAFPHAPGATGRRIADRRRRFRADDAWRAMSQTTRER
jgi:hypothetical protein